MARECFVQTSLVVLGEYRGVVWYQVSVRQRVAWLTILTTLFAPIGSAVGSLLKNTSFVLLLLGASVGGHFGAKYGAWKQARADAVQIRNGGQTPVTPRVRPIRDLIHVIVGDPPDAEESDD